MTLLQRIRHRPAKPRERKSGVEFCDLFMKETKGLYILALLLTAKTRTAEQCFVCSLEDCVSGISVDKEWALSWAKRIVMKNAIHLVASHHDRSGNKVFSASRQGDEDLLKPSTANRLLMDVLALEDLERMVFVMSVFERYSDRDCAALLGRLPDEIQAARMRALQQVAASQFRAS